MCVAVAVTGFVDACVAVDACDDTTRGDRVVCVAVIVVLVVVIGVDDAVDDEASPLPQPTTIDSAAHVPMTVNSLVIMSGAYADADAHTTTMHKVPAHHHRWLVRTLQASVDESINVIANHIDIAMAETSAHHPC